MSAFLLFADGRGFVVASSISLVSTLKREKLAHSTAPPLPTTPNGAAGAPYEKRTEKKFSAPAYFYAER